LAAATLSSATTEAAGDLEQRRQAVEHLVEPLQATLAKVESQLQTLEMGRQQAYTALTEQVRALADTQDRLKRETTNLVTALRAPSVRGRWGEMVHRLREGCMKFSPATQQKFIPVKSKAVCDQKPRAFDRELSLKQSQSPTGLADDRALVRAQIPEFKSVTVA